MFSESKTVNLSMSSRQGIQIRLTCFQVLKLDACCCAVTEVNTFAYCYATRRKKIVLTLHCFAKQHANL